MAEFSSAYSSAFDADPAQTTSPQTGPCDWPLLFACGTDAAGCEHLDSLAASGRAAFEQMAVDYLWNWTGRKFGPCDVLLRPCRTDCAEGRSTYWGASGSRGSSPYGTPWTPVLIRGEWLNIGCGACGDDCSCSSVSSLVLPGPVTAVLEVIIDGVVLDPSAYRVDDYRFLVRQDGGICLPAGSEGTWTVRYRRGVPVPGGGQIAAGRLACELARAACGDKTCGLPQRVQTVTRQGVTIAMLDAFDDVDKGHTGIWIIDSWVASVTRQPRSMTVISPDRRRTVRGRVTTS
jgi:hypothetical protein